MKWVLLFRKIERLINTRAVGERTHLPEVIMASICMLPFWSKEEMRIVFPTDRYTVHRFYLHFSCNCDDRISWNSLLLCLRCFYVRKWEIPFRIQDKRETGLFLLYLQLWNSLFVLECLIWKYFDVWVSLHVEVASVIIANNVCRLC